VVIPILALLLVFLAVKAAPLFQRMMGKYDDLNEGVQENLTAMRVVKAYVREKDETDKFRSRADDLRRTQVAAEKMLVSTTPVMQALIYMCIVAVLWFGGRLVTGHALDIGDLSTFITYITQILMSLMMLAMIFMR